MDEFNMNWIDKTISIFSPQRAFERMSYRAAIRAAYDSGDNGRMSQGWRAVNQTAHQADQMSRDIIRARARDVERNVDIAESIVLAYERNVIGTGFKLQAKLIKKDGEEDSENNKIIEELWQEWSKAKNCDLSEQQSFDELCRMIIRRARVDGGILVIKTSSGRGILPFALQLREVDDLDSNMNTTSTEGNRIISGIEIDEYNRPIKYHLITRNPDGYSTFQSTAIDAKNVIFLWDKKRPTQVREISPMANTLNRLKDTNDYIEALGVKAKIEACLSVFVKKNGSNSAAGFGRGGGKTDPVSGYKQEAISPGMIKYLQPGEDISTVNPSGSTFGARDFITVQSRLAGSGQGLSYEAVSRDMSEVNYSSARQGLLEDQGTYSILQKWLIEHFCEEVYKEFLYYAAMKNMLPFSYVDFLNDKKGYSKHKWIPSGWSWIDPLKEATANKMTLGSGQDTLERICAAAGRDWKDVLRQIAIEQKFAKELGIDINGGEVIVQTNETNNGESGKNDSSSTGKGAKRK